MQPRLVSNSLYSLVALNLMLCRLSARITGVSDHTWFMQCWEWNPGLLACQQAHYSSSLNGAFSSHCLRRPSCYLYLFLRECQPQRFSESDRRPFLDFLARKPRFRLEHFKVFITCYWSILAFILMSTYKMTYRQFKITYTVLTVFILRTYTIYLQTYKYRTMFTKPFINYMFMTFQINSAVNHLTAMCI